MEAISNTDTTQVPPSDTTSPPTMSRMADLEPDIILLIADQLVVSICPSQTNLNTRHLLLINKHWKNIMECHPSFTTVEFDLTSAKRGHSKHTIDDVKVWLSHPVRRKKMIYFFEFKFDDFANYETICNVLDNHLSDVKFNTAQFTACDVYKSPAQRFNIPLSLTARHLALWTEDFCSLNFDWNSLTQSLRENLVSICISSGIHYSPLPENLTLKSLRGLDIIIYSDPFVSQWSEFLQRHPYINDLSLQGLNYSPDRPPLVIDSQVNIETLTVDNLAVDLTSKHDRHIPLKSLAYEIDVTPHFGNWTYLTDTLTSLVFCIGPSPEATAFFEADHDLYDRKMFYKLKNIKYFEYKCESPSRFASSFNSGLYDDAMPLIEELELESDCISKEALRRFLNNHKHLRNINARVRGCSARSEGQFVKIYDTAARKSTYLMRNAS